MLHADHTADSLIPQRLNRIQPGGFGGGVVAGHHAYAKAEGEAGEDPFPGNDKARLQQERHAVPDRQGLAQPKDAVLLVGLSFRYKAFKNAIRNFAKKLKCSWKWMLT